MLENVPLAKNHYVPNFILRNFANNDGVLWVMDKETGGCWPITGGKDGRYDAFAENGYNPADMEDTLALLEANAAPVVRKIVRSSRSGDEMRLGEGERDWMCRFLLAQSQRVPRMRDWVMTEAQWEFPDEDRAIYRKMLCDLSDGDWHADIEVDGLNATDEERFSPERSLWRWMMSMSFDVATIGSESNATFLVSDEPCLMEGSSDPYDATCDIVVMPLAKDVFLRLSRSDISPGELGSVEELNQLAYRKTKKFIAGPSSECLARLKATGRESVPHWW